MGVESRIGLVARDFRPTVVGARAGAYSLSLLSVLMTSPRLSRELLRLATLSKDELSRLYLGLWL